MKLKLWFASLVCAGCLCAQAHPDFSGTWQQVNDRCEPKPRNAAYVYRAVVTQQGDMLDMNVTVTGSRDSGEMHLRYAIGGDETVYTGLDHDQFHAKAHWEGEKLVFSIVEHERGEVNKSTETWSLLEGGRTLQRVKQVQGKEDNKSRLYILERQH